jgi:hypothetical protein
MSTANDGDLSTQERLAGLDFGRLGVEEGGEGSGLSVVSLVVGVAVVIFRPEFHDCRPNALSNIEKRFVAI